MAFIKYNDRLISLTVCDAIITNQDDIRNVKQNVLLLEYLN